MMAKLLLVPLVCLLLTSWSPRAHCEADAPTADVAVVARSSLSPRVTFADKHTDSKGWSEDTQNVAAETKEIPVATLGNDSDGDDDEDKDARKENDVLYGFPLDDLDKDGLEALMDVDDDIFFGQTGEHVAKVLLLEDRKVNRGTSLGLPGSLSRRKRLGPILARAALAGARALFRNFARTGVTRSGTRVTSQYAGRGNYADATRYFQGLRPQNVKPFQSGKVSGQTGTVGSHRVTVRDGSSSGRPTLEVRSHNGQVVRKFRFNE